MLIILEQGEELVAVTMGKRDRNNQDSLTEVKDLTSQVSDGRVFVDVPNGLWCVNVIKTTSKGTGRKNYINTISIPSTADYNTDLSFHQDIYILRIYPM